MARENAVVLSDDELSQLKEARQTMFGSDEVPYGVVITSLIDNWEQTNE